MLGQKQTKFYERTLRRSDITPMDRHNILFSMNSYKNISNIPKKLFSLKLVLDILYPLTLLTLSNILSSYEILPLKNTGHIGVIDGRYTLGIHFHVPLFPLILKPLITAITG